MLDQRGISPGPGNGVAISIIRLNRAIAMRVLPQKADAGALGAWMMVVGAIALVWGLVSKVF